MSPNLFIYLFASIALVSAQSSNSSSVSTTIFTSSSTTSSSTAASSVSTLNPTTTSTIKPSNSTTALPTTTAAPKTSTTPPSTTTAKAPTPGPIPKAEQWSGNFTEGNKTCINLQFSVRILINYNDTSNNNLATGFPIPVNATVDPKRSYCSQINETEEAVTIQFFNQDNTSANLTLIFNKTDDDSYVNKILVSFLATPELMPGFNPKLFGQPLVAEGSGLNLFKVSSDHSYLCSAVQSATLKSSQGEDLNNVQIQFTDSKVEAYIKESNKGKFDIESDCKSADISDVVPIAVGAALAGLVIIVLIAYFVGRRRSRRLAYQSV